MNIKFYKTKDESTGLYDETVKDIFHSKTGAKKESYDKFIKPVIETGVLKKRTKIKILDICYGIGYNTKCAVNEFENVEQEIDALEYNDDYIILSPFINDGFDCDEIKLSFISQLFENGYKIKDISEKFSKYEIQNNSEYFDLSKCDLIKLINSKGYIDIPKDSYLLFLHNIYYSYISNDTKTTSKCSNINKFKIRFYTGDARKSILKLNSKYDLIFLDAFSPQKNPTLWTIDFISQIKDKMNYDSLLLSYSKSSPFRNALLKSGLFFGKTFIDGIDMGTIASLNKNLILNPPDNFDFGLLSSRAGIVYKDSCLNLPPDIILKNRENEIYNSDLISHTQFLKENKR